MPVGETTIQRPRPEQILAFASNPQQTLASLVSNSQVESRQLVACSKYATSLLCYRLRILKVGSESAQPTRERLPYVFRMICSSAKTYPSREPGEKILEKLFT